jgi:hypothetical protein
MTQCHKITIKYIVKHCNRTLQKYPRLINAQCVWIEDSYASLTLAWCAFALETWHSCLVLNYVT